VTSPLQPGESLIAAWDHEASPPAYATYAVGTGGARFLRSTPVAADAVEETTASLRTSKIRVGGAYGPVVWVLDRQASIWTETAAVAAGTPTELAVGGRLVSRTQITAVAATVAPNHVRRAVELELASGERVAVVAIDDETAALDPTYSRSDLLASDAWWVSRLGRELAAWLGVPFHNEAKL
jgi:hypothetical protein